MTTSTTPDPAADGATTDRVRLDLPADPRHAATARVVVASLAADAGFSVDEIDDLRLALNEAVALLADEEPFGDEREGVGNRPTGRIEIELVVSGGRIEIDVRRPDLSAGPEIDELADRILATVVDQHLVEPGLVRLHKATIGTADPLDAGAGTRPDR